MEKRYFPIVVSLLILPLIAHAQFDEIGIIFGTSNYSGDLTERHIEPLECNMANGIFLRKKLSQHFGLKMQFTRLVVSADDRNNTEQGGLWKRNLTFRSDIYEIGAQMEWTPVSLKSDENQFQPYFFGGIAGFYFNPLTELNGQLYELHHYRTEGVNYSKYQVAVPFGLGMRLNLRNRGTLGFELGARKTFTDYLDDVSKTYRSDLARLNNSTAAQLSYRGSLENHQSDVPGYPKPGTKRGNPKKKDWYYLFGLTLGINIGR